MSVLRVGSMYAGLGGLDLAVEAAFAHLGDVEVAWQLDLTGHEVRRRNWPEALQIVGNVNEIAPADLPRVDIVTGGFSCKGVSVAGKGELLEHPETAATYWGLLWFVAHLRPRWVVIENTPKMLTCMRELMEDHYGQLGYGATWAKCKASDVGAPHRRSRVFVVMVLGGRHRGVVEAGEHQPASASVSPTSAGREWPTPTSVMTQAENPHLYQARRERNMAAARGVPGESLPMAVRPWPTPLQSDAEDVKFNGHRRSPSLNFEARQRPWPTPTWNDHKASGSRNLEGSGANPGTSRTDAVRPDRVVAEEREWATPNAGNFNEGESHESHRARSEALLEAGSRPLSEPLGLQVRAWATPLASEAKGRRTSIARRADPDLLSEQVRPWATPVARDYKCGDLPNRVGSPSLSQQAALGKRLNPGFVEALQGLPIGWTLTEGPSQHAEAMALLEAPRWPRGRYPEDWDRTVLWPGYDWEPPRTLPDGPPCPGRPARLKLLGNMVNPQQGAHGIRAALRGPVQRGLFW